MMVRLTIKLKIITPTMLQPIRYYVSTPGTHWVNIIMCRVQTITVKSLNFSIRFLNLLVKGLLYPR